MTRRTIAALSILLVPAAVWAAEDEEVTREVDTKPRRKTLAERIPAVTSRVFVKRGRVELTPSLGLSLNDPFFDHIIVSGGVAYHVLESLSIGASADFYGSVSTVIPVTERIGQSNVKYNRPVYAARLEVAWAPIYGKVSLLAETVFHFDTYIAVGGGVLGSDAGATLAGSVALGQHFFLSEWIAVRLEIRDQIFELSRAGSEEHLQTLLSFSLGVCFYLPPSFEKEAL